MGEVDDFYKQEIENADSVFLKSPEINMPRKKAQEEYLKKIGKIRKNYYKKYKKQLANEKKNIKKNEIKEKKEKIKRFKSESVNMNFGFFEKLRIKKSIWMFKQKRKLKNFFFRITPKFLIYSFFKLRKKKNMILGSLFDFFEKKKESTKEGFKKTFDFIKKIFVKIIKIPENILIWIKSKLFKSKKKGDEKEGEKPKEAGGETEEKVEENKEEQKTGDNAEEKKED